MAMLTNVHGVGTVYRCIKYVMGSFSVHMVTMSDCAIFDVQRHAAAEDTQCYVATKTFS